MCKLSLEFIPYQNAHFPDFYYLPLPSNKCIVSSGQKKKVTMYTSQFHIKTTPQG
ncbi:hypothetical protein ES332_A11G152200v1 [Gossypium tomentosum]|uniref:Uncharacterized protein n=1 Tax=Gossypium tomentosum TaxID=34277 RepID=A0A5D2N9N9_GOSTO|nr:hypothetical protein ES332_A11G152200v1 [Gossypium tomentosum]